MLLVCGEYERSQSLVAFRQHYSPAMVASTIDTGTRVLASMPREETAVSFPRIFTTKNYILAGKQHRQRGPQQRQHGTYEGHAQLHGRGDIWTWRNVFVYRAIHSILARHRCRSVRYTRHVRRCSRCDTCRLVTSPQEDLPELNVPLFSIFS